MQQKALDTVTLHHFGFAPSDEQMALLQQLCAFYSSADEQSVFVLKGYAGTGKTSLISAFVKALQTMKKKTVLLAPTGRAAKVFAQKAEKMAFTIHKKIYRKEKMLDGSIRLGPAPNLHTNTMFLVDEASMIGDFSQRDDGFISAQNLLEDLINFVYKGKNCRLIFIGDTGQLPPVGDDFSPALSLDYLRNHYPQLSFQSFQLSTVLRQATDSDILLNATMLRTAQQKQYPIFTLTGNRDLVRLDGRDLVDEIDTNYTKTGIQETLLITRSNKRANLFNQQIRARILWYEDEIEAHDLLMVVRNNYFWLGNDPKQGFIANGESLEVERLLDRETKYGFQFVTARVHFIDYPDAPPFEAKIMLDVLHAETPNLPREKMKTLFFEVEKEYLHEHNKKKRYELILNDPYFNALQVKYAYAVTCHKSQGGQWHSVFVDQGFLTEDMLDANYFRWLYTAFTRATDKLYLVNFNGLFFGEDE